MDNLRESNKQLSQRKRIYIEDCIEKINAAILNEKIAEAGKEKVVTYNIGQVWEDYCFVLRGILYRWDNCNNLIEELNTYIGNILCSEPKKVVWICPPRNIADNLSYEFENLIVSFPRLNEDPLITEIERHIKTDNGKELRNNCYSKNDAGGLFWEINLLRNRAAHSTPGYYTMNKDLAARYMSISSKIRMIEFTEGRYKYLTSLISYRKNEIIHRVVQDYIIDKKYGEEYASLPLMELLFNSTKPKGKGKKEPQVLFIANVVPFDMNEEFYEISVDIFDYIINQIEIFKKEII